MLVKCEYLLNLEKSEFCVRIEARSSTPRSQQKMRIAIALTSLLMMQVSSPDSPDELVRRALEKDAADLAKVHSFKVTRTERTEALDKQERPTGILPEDANKKRIRSSIAKTFKKGRFKYTLAGLVDLNDRVTIAIHFEPGLATEQPAEQIEPDMNPIDREVERGFNEVLNHLRGRLYIDRDTLGIARFEASLTRDVTRKIMWVHRSDTTYEQMLFAGVWVPKKVVAITRYEKWVPWNRHFEQHTTTFENYQPRPPGN